ncbi:hypothetical protein BDB01DRAFT_784547 [Pilobolus umbonatus]|nr:hypothetical protein BDB01DRAFT_784547 [Pilobolus umbonatus]
MRNNTAQSSNAWISPYNIVDSLNQVMDPVSVLSDVDLQEELSLFANAQFTYDVAPGSAVEDKTEDNQPMMSTTRNHYRKDQQNMHSLLNVKLASIAEDQFHPTIMTPDAIASYYDNTPDCSPPNGYYSPNPSPPNGFHSPNPTPPNGYLANTTTTFQGVINPPINFYGDEIPIGYDEDKFMKTMRMLSSPVPYNGDHVSGDTVDNNQFNSSKKTAKNNQKRPLAKNESEMYNDMYADSMYNDMYSDNKDEYDMDDQDENKKSVGPISKEDKRRRNTAASARFRIKKKQREQALQKTANEMTEKAKAFESRVHELEREVKWLKALIVEKKDGNIEQLLMNHSENNALSSQHQ